MKKYRIEIGEYCDIVNIQYRKLIPRFKPSVLYFLGGRGKLYSHIFVGNIQDHVNCQCGLAASK